LHYFEVLTCLRLIKTFCILLSKLTGRVFIIFTVYIVSVFLACFYNACASDRFSARSCSLKRAYSRQPVSVVCYRPFIHSRHNAKDRTPKVGRDIVTVLAGTAAPSRT